MQSTNPFVTYWRLCQNEQGLARLPLFNDFDICDLPWDVVELYACRKFLDSQQYQLMHYESMGYFLPTPRTLASPTGFSMWLKWAEDEEELDRDRDGKSFSERYNVMLMEDYWPRYDYIIWDQHYRIAYYNTNWRSERYLDIATAEELIARPGSHGMIMKPGAPTSAPEHVKPTEVFGMGKV